MASALTNDSPTGVLWSRVNAAEALPGVMTPITWSFYGEVLEVNLRRGFAGLGVIPASATVYPSAIGDRLVGIFHGRLTVNVDVMRRLMGGLPGASGDDVERDMLGSVRAGVIDEPYPRRLPFILAKAPVRLARAGRDAARMREENLAWWRRSVGPDGPRDGRDPRLLLGEALSRFGEASVLQAQNRMFLGASAAQMTDLAQAVGQPGAASSLLAQSAGTEEARVADDLYAVAQGQLALATFQAQHGFHSTGSGELSARSWREDARPLEQLLQAIRASEPPAARRRRAGAEAAQVTAELLAGLSRGGRLRAQMLLRMVPATARTLETSKVSFLLTNDVGRAAVRAIGADLAARGRLDHADDAFHLFAEELLERADVDRRALVAERKELRAAALAIELPDAWEGNPVPRAAATGDEPDRPCVRTVTGLGVSPGVAEGRVRLITDPAEDIEIEPGEVLVCPTTDPSWLGLMTVASALVIDIGATASHGAIVARELGLPCVIGTRTGTADLRTGDLVRVDGAAGEVTVLRSLRPGRAR